MDGASPIETTRWEPLSTPATQVTISARRRLEMWYPIAPAYYVSRALEDARGLFFFLAAVVIVGWQHPRPRRQWRP